MEKIIEEIKQIAEETGRMDKETRAEWEMEWLDRLKKEDFPEATRETASLIAEIIRSINEK